MSAACFFYSALEVLGALGASFALVWALRRFLRSR